MRTIRITVSAVEESDKPTALISQSDIARVLGVPEGADADVAFANLTQEIAGQTLALVENEAEGTGWTVEGPGGEE